MSPRENEGRGGRRAAPRAELKEPSHPGSGRRRASAGDQAVATEAKGEHPRKEDMAAKGRMAGSCCLPGLAHRGCSKKTFLMEGVHE